MRKAIFLDRDGVLNQAIVKKGKPYPPASVTEVKITDDVLPALLELKKLGYLLIVVSNQPDVARGKTKIATVQAINEFLSQQLPLDAIRICYHDDVDQCSCRKPLPGLLTSAAQDYEIQLEASVMIGDRWKDIAAGKAAGCKTIFIDHDYQEPKPREVDFNASQLMDAATWIKTRLSAEQL